MYTGMFGAGLVQDLLTSVLRTGRKRSNTHFDVIRKLFYQAFEQPYHSKRGQTDLSP